MAYNSYTILKGLFCMHLSADAAYRLDRKSPAIHLSI